jgi:hypothetical protein
MLDQKTLRELLCYDPQTGEFTRRTTRCGRSKAGDHAGRVRKDGYIEFGIRCPGTKIDRTYLAHRVAWTYVYGTNPKNDIDHIDGNRANNRIENLREATRRQNCMNRMTMPSEASLRGVTRSHGRRWLAQIQVAGKKKYLGTFATPEAAADAYRAAAKKFFGQFARPL